MVRRLLLGLVGAAILGIAAAPVGAEQTFWTIETGGVPSPAPTYAYPLYLQYYYVPTPVPGTTITPPTAVPGTMMTPVPVATPPPYRTRPIARHT
jgi:hypothetical protein